MQDRKNNKDRSWNLGGHDVRILQKQIVGWNNPKGELHYYFTLDEFNLAKAAIELRALEFIKSKWRDIEEDEELLVFLIKQQLINDALLYEYPLHNFVYLQEFRRDVFEKHRNDYITLYDWTPESLKAYFIQWIQEELIRTKYLISVVDADTSIIINEKVVAKAMLSEFINALNFQIQSKSLPVIQTRDSKPSVGAIALFHVFWGRYEHAARITKTNKSKWAETYKVSPNTLLDKYNFLIDKENREPKSERKNSVEPFIEKFEIAVELLKNKTDQGFKEANNELQLLKIRYQDCIKLKK